MATVSSNYGEDPMAYWVRGIARYQMREYEAAIEDFSQIIRLAPENGVGYHGRARAREALGQGSAALADYDEAARLDADNASYLNAACWAHVIANQAIDRALEQCNAAIALEPRASIYDSRGFLHLRRRNHAAALADFEAALRDDADTHTSRYGRGLARLALGEAEAGQRDVDESTAADPQSIAALRQAGFTP
jgi:tetratricopeptide (TPR) repeat protein